MLVRANWTHGEGAIMKPIEFPGLANTPNVRPTSRWSLDRILSMIRTVARAVAADHALAQIAATKAESSRVNLAEVRALYVPPPAPHRQNDVGGLRPDGAQTTRTARKVLVDLQTWGAPFPKSMKYR
jgi:hypothetical protein